MLARPEGLSDELLTRALASGWDITPAAVSYLAVGYGSHHWQTTSTGGARWFVTVDDLAERLRSPADTIDAAYGRLRSALLTARALHDSGVSFAVTPAAAVDGDVLHRIGEAYAMAVYPFVDGRAGEFGDALSAADLEAILPLITVVHGASAGVRDHARADDFLLAGAGVLRRALDDLSGRWDGGPYGESARRLLARHASSVERLLGHRDQLAGQARSQPDRMVLTHGEPHPGNFILVGPQPMLVDWDTALIAPPERDLWLLDPGDGSFTGAYTRATGRDILPPMLDLYRLTWELSDVVGCVTRFTGAHGDTVTDRAEWEILSRSLSLSAEWPIWVLVTGGLNEDSSILCAGFSALPACARSARPRSGSPASSACQGCRPRPSSTRRTTAVAGPERGYCRSWSTGLIRPVSWSCGTRGRSSGNPGGRCHRGWRPSSRSGSARSPNMPTISRWR